MAGMVNGKLAGLRHRGGLMKRTTLFIALVFAAGTALANNCPNEMKAIDAALPKSDLPANRIAEVKKLRADGETLHKAGKHAESMAALGKAKGILGIK
jgi:hypothetical protein